MTTTETALKTTPLHGLHHRLGARMVPFAGYDMPVQFDGVMAEHAWTRDSAGLFDVSHMGQAFLVGPDHETTAQAIEALTTINARGLKPGQARYTLLMHESGGVRDDLIVTRPRDPSHDGWLHLVVNAACKDDDFAHISAHLPAGVELRVKPELALLALQGPKARTVLAGFAPEAQTLTRMTSTNAVVAGVPAHISCSGYTGEDGFEISVFADKAEAVAEALLAHEAVKPIGLGARDTLRLEAGLCLYGHDLDQATSPVEAGLTFAVGKRRREEGGYPGAERVQRELAEGPARKLVGVRLEGRAPAREGAEIHVDGHKVGAVTSGSFAPSVGGPVALGYVAARYADVGGALDLIVRGKALPGRIVTTPFVPHRYVRG